MAKPTIELIPPQKLTIDNRVQRLSVDMNRARKIADNLNIDSIGVLAVSRRLDGTLVVLDGAHRKTALELIGFGDVPVPCEVYEGLELRTEALMFRLRNNTSKVQYLDKFRVRLVEEDPVALDVSKIIAHHGWGIPGTQSDRPNLAAVQALENLRLRNNVNISGYQLADITLGVITGAWGHNTFGVDYRVIAGLGSFTSRFVLKLNIGRLTERLSTYPGGPSTLLGNALGVRQMIVGSTMQSAVAELITEAYNKYLQGPNRLPSWRTSVADHVSDGEQQD